MADSPDSPDLGEPGDAPVIMTAAPGADASSLADLRALLASRGVPAGAGDEALIAAARAAEHKLAITLLSGLAAEGQTLSAEQASELAAHRHRTGRYREAWSVVSAEAPDAEVVKGWTIGDRYPAGLLRSAGDLDVVCPAGQLWRAAKALLAQGWEFGALTIFPERPGSATLTAGWHVLVELIKPADSPYIDQFYGVELRTADVATSIYRPAVRLADDQRGPVAGNLLALAAERWERPFRTRDIYDLAVLAEDLDQAQAQALSGGLAATGLGPALLELVSLLRRSGLPQAGAASDRVAACLPGGRGAAWTRALRVARALRVWANPVRAAGLIAMSTVDADRGAVADRLAQSIQRRTGCWRLLRLGLPLFAVPLDEVGVAGGGGDASGGGGGVELVRRGSQLVASTPAGRFLMVAGSVPQAWLDQAVEQGGLR